MVRLPRQVSPGRWEGREGKLLTDLLVVCEAGAALIKIPELHQGKWWETGGQQSYLIDTRRKEQFSPLVPYSFSPSLLFCWTRNAFYVVLSSLRSLSSKQTCPLPRVQEPEAARLSCLANVLVRIFWLLVIETQVNLFEAKEIHWLMWPARWGCGSVSQVWVSWSFLPLASLAVHRLAFTDRLALAVAGLQVPLPLPHPQHPHFCYPKKCQSKTLPPFSGPFLSQTLFIVVRGPQSLYQLCSPCAIPEAGLGCWLLCWLISGEQLGRPPLFWSSASRWRHNVGK